MRQALSEVVFTMMARGALVTLALVATSAFNHLAADVSFPYTAFVEGDEVEVRSGPGEEFYATERLPMGTAVEVYRHVDGGWCAIRPTPNSFSWLAAEHLEILENPSLARVINVPAKTRVGSQFGDLHDVEYVSLRAGEVVELIGTKMLREASGEPTRRWFKISPPSGEFRWVHADELSRDAITKTAPSETAGPQQSPGTDLNESAPPEPELLEIASLADETMVGSGIAATIKTHPLPSPVKSETDPKSAETTGFSPLDPQVQQVAYEETTASSAVAEEQNTVHVNAVTWQAVGTRTDVLTAPEPRSYLDRYNALNLLLSRTVLEEIHQWDFQNVRDQTVLLQETAATPDEKKMAAALLAKIDEFDSLKQRHVKLSEPTRVPQQASTVESPAPLPALADEPIAEMDMPKIVKRQRPTIIPDEVVDLGPPDAVRNSVFDATGVLVSVRSRRSDMPRYALTDDSGQVTRFISTSNGDALSAFLNKRVGIIGKAGFLRRFNKPHLVASKVVHLQR